MNPETAIDVILVNHNSGEALDHCLKTLGSGDSEGLKIWVVDNASGDDSATDLQSDMPLSIISNPENLGFAKACNQGAKQGQAEFLAFINPDCFVNVQQLQKLSDGLKNDAEAALIGCRVLNEDGSLQAASRRRLPTFWRVVFHVTGLSRWSWFPGINIHDIGQFASVKKVSAVNGACLLVKRTAFEKIQGFDENYPLHFEDLDLFARLQKGGGRVLYDSTVEVVHLKGHSKQTPKQIKVWKKQGMLRYFNQHRPRWEAALVKFILALS